MATAAANQLNEIVVLRHQNQLAQKVVRMNTEGITHGESLVQSIAGGNSMNWVVGHLLCVYNNVLPTLAQTPVMLNDRLKAIRPRLAAGWGRKRTGVQRASYGAGRSCKQD